MTKDEMIQTLRTALQNAKRDHYSCEDHWYQCPKHPDGTANEFKKDECDCGADEFNAEIDRVLRETAPERTGANLADPHL